MRSILLALLFISIPGICNSSVIIKGKIQNYDGASKIYYYRTLQGIMTSYWEEALPNSNGSFTIKFENEGLGTCVLSFKKISFRLLFDKDSEIFLELDQNNMNLTHELERKRNQFHIRDSIRNESLLKIDGDYSEVNYYYNHTQRTAYFGARAMNGISTLIYHAAYPEVAHFIIDSLINKETDIISLLSLPIDQEDKSTDLKQTQIRKFLRNEVKVFYGSIFLKGMQLKRRKQINEMSKDPMTTIDIYNPGWEKEVETYLDEFRVSIEVSANSWDYLQFIESIEYSAAFYKQYFPEQTNPPDEYINDILFAESIYMDDSVSLLVYKLQYMQIYLLNQLFYSPILLDAVYELQRQYPDCEHFDYYIPYIEKLKASVKARGENFDEAVLIRKKYSSFRDLIKYFYGQNLLIDIWATWCRPCIEDFEYKDRLTPFTERRKLNILYVSIDKIEWEDRWEQSIKYNQLAGYHVRVNKDMIDDMWSVIGGEKGTIPRYLL
ncbi:MAG: hypothetical protein HKN67_10695, partial [Saprospiraceae bacterium]|nr:hypothetical protein [Saprospiraceae bacterium]